MENMQKEKETEVLPIGVLELPGEPAIVINGVPDVPPPDSPSVVLSAATDADSPQTIGCGEWLEGREVKKFFLGEYYSGTVVKFDRLTGWYRVEYEDGDSEDLDWHELEAVLLPLDVTIPLKSLALRVVKNRQRLSHKFGRTRKTKNLATKRKETLPLEESNSASLEIPQNGCNEVRSW